MYFPKTLRQEIESLGLVRVRLAMSAFKHRGMGTFRRTGDTDFPAASPCPDGVYSEHRLNPRACCFLSHAFETNIRDVRWFSPFTRLESVFEKGNREQLYSECVAFLAEHGEVPEPQHVL